MTRIALLLTLLLTLLLALPAAAAELRVGNAVDTATVDPHGSTETNTLGTILNIYESLVRRGPNLTIEPGLAESWELVSPTRWRFHLRTTNFQDGTKFTADDVVFSVRRARESTSEARPAVRTIATAEAVAPDTIELTTTVPDPILLSELCNFFIMSRAWAEAHGSSSAYSPTRNAGTENWATRHANGTGPYILDAYETGVRVALKRNPAWWDPQGGNVDTASILTIGNDATRIAALLSGSIDVIIPVPEQAAGAMTQRGLQVLRGRRLAVMFLGMDMARPKLLYADGTDRNPFADVRVRRAVALAIDDVALREVVVRGAVLPAGSMIPEGVEGFAPGMDRHTPADPARARDLMREAGYPDGFGVTLDCTSDQYPNDEAVCTALAPMLARIGIRVSPRVESRVRFFPRITGKDTSLYLMAWYAPTFDAHHILWNLLHSPTNEDGVWNAAGYADPAMDQLIDGIASEMDGSRRRDMIARANQRAADAAVYVPLYQLTLAWAAKPGISLVMRPDNRLDLRLVSVKE